MGKDDGLRASPSSIQLPSQAHLPHSSSWSPPTYEQHVNENMRMFGEPEPQANFHPFDGVEDPPKLPHRQRMWNSLWFWIVLLLVTLGLAGAIATTISNSAHESRDDAPLSSRSEVTVTVAQTTTIFLPAAPPIPTSTQTVIETAEPSTSTSSLIIVEVTSTTNPSATTLQTSTTATSETETTTTSETDNPTTSSTTTATSQTPSASFAYSPITSIRSSTTQPSPSSTTDSLPPTSRPSSSITSTTLQTARGWAGRCGVPGESC